MRNPLFEEAAAVYTRRREYLTMHLVYIGVLSLFLLMLWPSRGLLYFFRTDSEPAAFQAMIIAQAIAITCLSLYSALDRLAETQIIRYSEWIERTGIPIRVLGAGKIISGVSHTILLTLIGVPFAVIAAGPAGITLDAVLASELVVLLSGISARMAGMLLGHVGEQRYFIRVTGAWLFLAIVFIVTLQIGEPVNPVLGVLSQHTDVRPGGAAYPLAVVAASQLGFAAALGALYVFSLSRHRSNALRRQEA